MSRQILSLSAGGLDALCKSGNQALTRASREFSSRMVNIAKGIISGLAASASVAGAVFLAAAVDLMNVADPMQAVSGVTMTPVGLSWVLHFGFGTFIWGSLFALLSPFLPGPFWIKGAVFGVLAWLLIIASIPAVDHVATPQINLGSLLLHLLFGAVAGLIYGNLVEESRRSRGQA